MKKLSIILIALILLTACSADLSGSDYVGEWRFAGTMSKQGVYTPVSSDLNNSPYRPSITLNSDGTAIVSPSGSTKKWSETDNGFKIGRSEYKVSNEKIVKMIRPTGMYNISFWIIKKVINSPLCQKVFAETQYSKPAYKSSSWYAWDSFQKDKSCTEYALNRIQKPEEKSCSGYALSRCTEYSAQNSLAVYEDGEFGKILYVKE